MNVLVDVLDRPDGSDDRSRASPEDLQQLFVQISHMNGKV